MRCFSHQKKRQRDIERPSYGNLACINLGRLRRLTFCWSFSRQINQLICSESLRTMSLFLKKYDWHRVKLIGLRHGPSTPFVLVNGPSLKVFSWMVWHKSNLFRRALFVLQSLTLALHGPMLINSSLLILFIFPDWGRQQSTFVTGLVRFFRQLFGVLSLESNEALLAQLVPFVLPREFRHPQSRAFGAPSQLPNPSVSSFTPGSAESSSRCLWSLEDDQAERWPRGCKWLGRTCDDRAPVTLSAPGFLYPFASSSLAVLLRACSCSSSVIISHAKHLSPIQTMPSPFPRVPWPTLLQ